MEGALRAVLEPSIKKHSGHQNGHQNAVNAVLEVLDVDPAAPVAAFWLELGVKGGRRNLPAWAHRSGLDAPRPVDSEFRDLVRDFELMLDEVLERFHDRYVEVFARLDQLLAVAAPTRGDADALRQRFRNNQVTRHYFFSRASAAWLRPLRDAGFFSAPPEPVVNDDGSVTLPSWPETEYLVRVVADDPDDALEAARGVPVTDNSRVTWNLVQIALRLPRTGSWTWPTGSPPPHRAGTGCWPRSPMGALVANLAAGGHRELRLHHLGQPGHAVDRLGCAGMEPGRRVRLRPAGDGRRDDLPAHVHLPAAGYAGTGQRRRLLRRRVRLHGRPDLSGRTAGGGRVRGDLVPLPAGPVGEYAVIGQAGIGVLERSGRAAQAADFLAFFTNPADSAKLAQFFPPPRQSQLTAETLAEANPLLSAEQLQSVVVNGIATGVLPPTYVGQAEISQTVRSQLDALWPSDADVEAVLGAVCEAIQQMLDR